MIFNPSYYLALTEELLFEMIDEELNDDVFDTDLLN